MIWSSNNLFLNNLLTLIIILINYKIVICFRYCSLTMSTIADEFFVDDLFVLVSLKWKWICLMAFTSCTPSNTFETILSFRKVNSGLFILETAVVWYNGEGCLSLFMILEGAVNNCRGVGSDSLFKLVCTWKNISNINLCSS